MANRKKIVAPEHWASFKPFGLGEGRPPTYRSILRAMRQNRAKASYAWQIMTTGTCDGCALGAKGLRDWTLDEVHLCDLRVSTLRYNTMPAFDPAVLSDVTAMTEQSDDQLAALGRLPAPMIRRAGERGFRRIGWDAALDRIAARITGLGPDRIGVHLADRVITNETAYAAQKAARALGCNTVNTPDHRGRAGSAEAMRHALGVRAATCSYSDWLGTELIVFVGADLASNQPAAMKYLYHAKRAGTKILSVCAGPPEGMLRYWVPSKAESALFGTKITDSLFGVRPKGEGAFLAGAMRHMVERGWVDRDFIERHTSGFVPMVESLADRTWEDLETRAGASREQMLALAEALNAAGTAVFVWGTGVEDVPAIINLALSKGYVGRPRCGLMPLDSRPYEDPVAAGAGTAAAGAVSSGSLRAAAAPGADPVMGADPHRFPGGLEMTEANADRFATLWGFPVSSNPGYTTAELISAAAERRIDTLITSGGNLLAESDQPSRCRLALTRVPMRVHIGTCLTGQMLVDPAETVILLPAQTRYETAGGVTQTSAERRVIFSPEVEGPRVDEAWPEYRIFGEIAARVRPHLAAGLRFAGTAEVRAEIARAIPEYAAIQHLAGFGDAFQVGGPYLCHGWRFPTADWLARFSPIPERWFTEPIVEPVGGASRSGDAAGAEQAAAVSAPGGPASADPGPVDPAPDAVADGVTVAAPVPAPAPAPRAAPAPTTEYAMLVGRPVQADLTADATAVMRPVRPADETAVMSAVRPADETAVISRVRAADETAVMRPVGPADETAVMRPVGPADETAVMRPVRAVDETAVMSSARPADETAVIDPVRLADETALMDAVRETNDQTVVMRRMPPDGAA